MANQPTLHELIAAHPGMAHSAWAARHPEATLQERSLMLKRFERIGQLMMEEWNRHRRNRSEPKTHYLIPGEPGYVAEQDFLDSGSTNHHFEDDCGVAVAVQG